MKHFLFSVLSTHCVAVSLIYQTKLIKLSDNLKLKSNTCFNVKRKVECALACCTGDKCNGFYYAEPGRCQCKGDVSTSRDASEEGAFELWMISEGEKENTVVTKRQETHFLICGFNTLHWFRHGEQITKGSRSFPRDIETFSLDYVQSTNTLYWLEGRRNGIISAVISFLKIGPRRIILKGNPIYYFKVDFDKDIVIWATQKKSKSATLKGERSKIIYNIENDSSIVSICIDKRNSRTYFGHNTGEIYITDYEGGQRRLIVKLNFLHQFYNEEDQTLYLSPRNRYQGEASPQKKEFVVLKQLFGISYFVVHNQTIYRPPRIMGMNGLDVIRLDGRKLPPVGRDAVMDASIVFL